MSYTIIRPKTNAEWLKQRENGIGSSEVSAILGVNPYFTPLQLWRRKKGLDAPVEENFAMKAGHYLEDAVSRFYADEAGVEIIKASAGDWLARDNERPYLQVSPDRTFWLPGEKHNAENKGICECKTTQRDIDETSVPKAWYCQLTYQLGVMGLRKGALAWLKMGREFGYLDVTFDPDFYAFMVEQIERFWTDNIIGNKEPDAVSVADVLIKYPAHLAGKSIEADGELLQKYYELKDVREELAKLDERKKALEDGIKLAMGDAESLCTGGETLATWKAPKTGVKFDEKTFKANNPETWKAYTYETQGARRFLLK